MISELQLNKKYFQPAEKYEQLTKNADKYKIILTHHLASIFLHIKNSQLYQMAFAKYYGFDIIILFT